MQEYDLATDKWTKKGQVPFAADHMTIAGYKDKIYIFGGTGPATEGGPNTTLAKTWEYTPAADTWKELAPMPLKRTAAVSVELGGKIYVIGGNSDALTVGTNDVFDPATNKWESHKAMPTPATTRRQASWAARSTSSAAGSRRPTWRASLRPTSTWSKSTIRQPTPGSR